ncbi:caspase-6-like isoform X1 [Archocentrus centrarchus]|uniref:caspase-6-like isoform X1 n=2 Tax=Archocentrus centrarchus TaxID=63155 RepID=UPI0011EA4E1D|nr:caspase-6-like isoform X1 [Archocentrus centrarchus]
MEQRLLDPHTSKNQTETDASAESILEEYKMGNKRRGRALIFNQERFFWRLTHLKQRCGTNADRDNLEKRLKNLNFEVRSYDNYKQVEVLDKIAEAAEEDHSDADCFLLAFLSHGEDDHVYCHDGKISIRKITSMFKGDKCESLVGKPKIFIIQACHGNQYDEAVAVTPASFPDTETKVDVDACAMRTLPAGADFIMCYSVAEGYYSFRETKNGSWYIQDLCEMIQKYGETLEFTELLTLVNSKVSKRNIPVPCPPKLIGKKQMPCFASMLTKKLYFRPKKDQCHTSVFK